MTISSLTEQDLERLVTVMPQLDFKDAQRRAVLLEGCSRDVQAAPGSGKTTLLAAKLLLMGEKWTHSNRGICVLSHTNVARDEIAKRLGATATGAKLLRYPHFVGTIHAFVNQYLALPLLRSDGDVVDVIDNEIFAARAFSLLSSKWKLRSWVRRNPHQGPQAIASLRYEGAALTLGWGEGALPGEGTDSWAEAKALKDQLSARGVFRHDDMFAFAEKLLLRFPNLPQRLSYRFPMVLIDEMQDTSWVQEDLLSRAFDTTVVMQRYGDRNQRILSSDADSTRLTFPRAGHLSVTTTKRFPESIASVVRSIQEHGEAVVAEDPSVAQLPILMLYDTHTVTSVIDAFGRLVLNAFSDEELRNGPVKAVCARKQSDAKSAPGRHLCDYWPGYITSSATPKGEESVFRLLVDPPTLGLVAINLDHRARDVKRAILLALRGAGSPIVADLKDANSLFRKITSDGQDSRPVRRLCRDLVVGHGHTLSTESWSATVDTMFLHLRALLPIGIDRTTFGAMETLAAVTIAAKTAVTSNQHVVQHSGRSVPIHIGTIASVKGETHLATLVLEAYGGNAKRHDLEAALQSIASGIPLPVKASNTLRSLYRNLYVATSRPSRFLCLAMNRNRAPEEQVNALIARGWQVSYI